MPEPTIHEQAETLRLRIAQGETWLIPQHRALVDAANRRPFTITAPSRTDRAFNATDPADERL